MSTPVKSFTIPATSAVGVFAGTSVTAGPFDLLIQDQANGGSLYLVNDATSTTGIGLQTGNANNAAEYSMHTDGSEVYLYNAGGSTATVWVAFLPVSGSGPISATFNY